MLISFDDPQILFGVLKRGLWKRLALSGKRRTALKWNNQTEKVRHWFEVPAVERRMNRRISGDEKVGMVEHLARTHLLDRKRTAITLGCGNARVELEWAAMGCFSSLKGYDLSPGMIDAATKAAADAGLSDIATFEVKDGLADTQKVDVVIFCQSLHHFTNVPGVLARVKAMLNPGGMLIAHEFVGPRRQQWTRTQIAFIDSLLRRIPAKFRELSYGGTKHRQLTAGALFWWLNDPSEAVESDLIEPEILRQFDDVTRYDQGGTISHLLFHDIAANFLEPDGERYATMVLDIEDELLQAKKLPSDFVIFVCK